MKKSLFLILFLISFLYSCKHEKPIQKKEIKKSKKSTVLKSINVEPKKHKSLKELKELKLDAFVMRDSTVRSWRKELMNISDLNLNFEIEKEPYPNRHDKNVIDTIETLTFDKSKFVFL